MGERFFKNIEQPQISDEEIDNASENELADIMNKEIKKENYSSLEAIETREINRWSKMELLNKLKDEIENEYKNFILKRIDELDDDAKKRILEITGVNLNEVFDCFNERLIRIIDIIEDRADSKLIIGSSFAEILRIVSAGFFSNIIWISNNLQSNKINRDYFRVKLSQEFSLFFEYFAYYIEELINNEVKLNLESQERLGYVGSFDNYLTNNFRIDSGQNRVLAFYLFSKLEKNKKLDFLNNEFNDFLEKTKNFSCTKNDKTGEKGLKQYLKIDKIKEDFSVKK